MKFCYKFVYQSRIIFIKIISYKLLAYFKKQKYFINNEIELCPRMSVSDSFIINIFITVTNKCKKYTKVQTFCPYKIVSSYYYYYKYFL